MQFPAGVHFYRKKPMTAQEKTTPGWWNNFICNILRWHGWENLTEGSLWYPFSKICANPTGLGEGQKPEGSNNTIFNFAEYRKCTRCKKIEDFRCADCVEHGTGACYRRMWKQT